MNIVDIIILILIVVSVLDGWKKGAINSVISLVGTILIFIVSFYLKSPISSLMYEYLPFFSFNGIFENITVLNILVYEALSFLITVSILFILLKIILKVTGIVDKIISKLILLGLPSKILGACVGFVQGYILVFICIFVLSFFAKPSVYIEESKLSSKILSSTPILSDIVGNTINSVNEIYDVCLNNDNKEQANLDSLDILMKYNILNYDSALSLIEKDKLNVEGAEKIINKYKGEQYDKVFER